MIENNEKLERNTIKTFKKEKVMTMKKLTGLLNCSRRTVQRRLVKWQTYTSYNHNGKWYTLPTIPKFDENGLWGYKAIFFSKNGNLKQTILRLINDSPKGLTVIEIANLLKVSLGSFLSQERNLQKMRREKIANRYVYFSSDETTFLKQKQKREKVDLYNKLTQIPTDTEAVTILVEKIKCPNLNIGQLTKRLNRKGHKIKKEAINKLFEYHGIQKKN